MRKILLSVVGASVLLVAGARVGSAGDVNCKVVNKNLETGRTEQEVAETMVISVSDVKKCKEEKAAAAAAAPAAGEKAAPAPAMGGDMKH